MRDAVAHGGSARRSHASEASPKSLQEQRSYCLPFRQGESGGVRTGEADRHSAGMDGSLLWAETEGRVAKPGDRRAFFGDSEHILLLQVADLISYVIRRYVEVVREAGRV